MRINHISQNNIRDLSIELQVDQSLAIAGLSGSGKTTFCSLIHREYQRRLSMLLSKSDRNFLFPKLSKVNYGSILIENISPIDFYHKDCVTFTPRSTVGTHSGIFKSIRRAFAKAYHTSAQFFSFNCLSPTNEAVICGKCKGRGSYLSQTCPECHGTRYSAAINDYRIEVGAQNLSIAEIADLPMECLSKWADELSMSNHDIALLEICKKLDIGYLSLNRTIGTLSGGELTRLLLAEAMASTSGKVLIIDEPSQGLDEANIIKLIDHLNQLGSHNTIWVIDHSQTMLDSAQECLIFGPGSGMNGGRIVKEECRPKPVAPDNKDYIPCGFYRFKDLHCRNLELAELQLPKDSIIGITGCSGCGKSTLIRNCLIPYLKKHDKTTEVLFIEQQKTQRVTGKSTLATFLQLSSVLEKLAKFSKTKCKHCAGSGINLSGSSCKFCNQTGIDYRFFESLTPDGLTIGEMYQKSIDELLPQLPEQSTLRFLFEKISQLGIGHLSLSRSIRSLSTGEYQALYLVSCLNKLELHERYIIFLDEPTKGLSQNIVNGLAYFLRELQNTYNITIVYIEHDLFMLEQSDFIIDFGSTRKQKVDHLVCVPSHEWKRSYTSVKHASQKLASAPIAQAGLTFAPTAVEGFRDFKQAQEQYYYNFRSFSSTANWIYGSYESEKAVPVIAVDFSTAQYSSGTKLYLLANIIALIVKQIASDEHEAVLFDFYDINNLCAACKGQGVIESVDFDYCIKNDSEVWNKGFLLDEITAVLKQYNFSRVKSMFTNYKAITGSNLSSPVGKLTPEEKKVLLYGDWKYPLKGHKETSYVWRGLNFLIKKYGRYASPAIKDAINKGKHSITCPVCNGGSLNHQDQLMYEGKSIYDYLNLPLNELVTLFPEIPRLKKLSDICGPSVSLMSDASDFDLSTQCALKLFEIEAFSFAGFQLYFKAIAPFRELEPYKSCLEGLSTCNKIHICDSTEDFLSIDVSLLMKKHKLNAKNTVYEALGYKNINKSLKALAKKFPCKACGGKGKIQIISEDDNINNLTQKCSCCAGTAIDSSATSGMIDGMMIHTWLFGTARDMDAEYPAINLLQKLSEVDESELKYFLTKLNKIK